MVFHVNIISFKKNYLIGEELTVERISGDNNEDNGKFAARFGNTKAGFRDSKSPLEKDL